MAYALVGTIGAASQGAAVNTAVTPAYGQTATAGNLLICFCAGTGGTSLPVTPSGWTLGAQTSGSNTSATIFYKIAAGGDAAPAITASVVVMWAAQLAEFSGNSATPADKTGIATGTTSPITATFGSADTASGELLLMCGADFRSAARTPNDTWTSNHATITQAGNNNGVSSANHYSFGYSLATTSNTGANTNILTASVTTSITGLAICGITFQLAAVVANVIPDIIMAPMTPGASR